MPNYSAGYWDLNSISMSEEGSDPIYVSSCPRTTETLARLFFEGIGASTDLDPDKYGVTYILGYRFAEQTIEKQHGDKDIVTVMTVRPLADPSKKIKPNALPSQQIYGFKTKEKHAVLSNRIIGYRVYPVPKVKARLKPLPVQTDIDISGYKKQILLSQGILTERNQKQGKYSNIPNTALAFPDGQRAAKSTKAGGKVPAPLNLNNKNAYASRYYKSGSEKIRYYIESGRYIYSQVNQQIKLVGQLGVNGDSLSALMLGTISSKDDMTAWNRVDGYVNSPLIQEAYRKGLLNPVNIRELNRQKKYKAKRLKARLGKAKDKGDKVTVSRLERELSKIT